MKCENCENEHDGSYGSGRFCSSKCARGFSTKSKREEINKKIGDANRGRVHSKEYREKVSENNRNRSKEVLEKISTSMKKHFDDNPEARKRLSELAKNRDISDETRAKLSEIAKDRGFGGVRQSIRIKYNGKTLGSSYELEVVKSLDENNIRWDTCSKFHYIDPNGKVRTYTPDIYLIDYDVYLDPKNDFLINNINPTLGFKDLDKIKLVEEQNSIKVIVLNKDQLNWEYIVSLVK